MKNNSRFILWAKRLSWVVILLDLISIFLVPTEINSHNFTFMLAYGFWLFITLLLATTSLMVIHHESFQSWVGWITPIIILFFSNLFSSGYIQVNNSGLSFFYILLTIFCMWGVGVATIIFLWYRDYGLRLVASALVIITWIGFVVWNIQGNLFDLLIKNMNQPEVPSPLWWLNPLFCVLWWVIPIGIISFVVHTFRIIAKEISQNHS